MAVLQPGTKLKHGTFEIVSLLGSGGFGEVYLGRQARVERDVAIKVLHPHIGANADMVERFQREAFAAANLAHPHVLTVFDFDYDEGAGAWFLAMQYVTGGRTLRDVLGPPRSVAETVYLIEGIASALDAAHARGIVHRDVKPENVMLDGNRALLTDFGIAHLSEMSSMTAIGLTIGTPAYMSPEQATGQTIGARSDQYALAVMVYEMLAGRLPFVGEPVALMVQHASADPPPLETFNPEIVPSARAAVARAMRKNPEERFSSCTAFIDELRVAVMQSASRRGITFPPAPVPAPAPLAEASPPPAAPSIFAPPPTPGTVFGQPAAPLAGAQVEAPSAQKGLSSVDGDAAARSAEPPPPAEPDAEVIPPADRTVMRPRIPSTPAPRAEQLPGLGNTAVRASEVSPAPQPEEELPSDPITPPTVMRPRLAPSQQEVSPADAASEGVGLAEQYFPPSPFAPDEELFHGEDEVPPAARTVLRASAPQGDVAPPALAPAAPADATRLRPSLDRAASESVDAAQATVQRASRPPEPYVQPSAPASDPPAAPAPPLQPAPVAVGGARGSQPLLVGAGVGVLVGLVALVLVGRALLGPRDEPGTTGPNPPIAQASPGVRPTVPAVAPNPTAGPNSGIVRVTSFPDGAAIMVNGAGAGRAPSALALDPGEYTLTVVSQSYEDWTQQVRVTAGQQIAVEANLAPQPALKALEIGQARMGRDAYMDPAGTIRLGTVADTFTLADEVNAIVYLKPKSFRIRDLSFQATTRWQRAGDAAPLVLQAEQQVSRDWEETFVRACAPAAAIDPRGSNTPLRVEILIDGELVGQFTFRIGPGNPAATSSNPCDANTLPSRMAGVMQSQG